jgi:flagellum-specific ATP synthase
MTAAATTSAPVKSVPAPAVIGTHRALANAIETLQEIEPMRLIGSVSAIKGMSLLVEELPVPVGALVRILPSGAGRADPIAGEVVGFSRDHAIVMLLDQAAGIRPGDRVVGEQASQSVAVGERLLGRVVDGLARPIDRYGSIRESTPRPLNPLPIRPLDRARIGEPLYTGVRAVDLMTTLGRGQRLGVFAGPGVGKSTLLGTIAKRTSADVNVIALIGERGREVKDFIEHNLGPEGLARSVVIVATGDESPLMRLRAARVACSAAEYFRDQGKHVLLMMDSITRFAHAQRQVGLSVGEPPATKGYTPSVFSQMALLLERAGVLQAVPGAVANQEHASGGSITGLYTILVEGDDMTEPVADAARGILDGHIILSRRLAQKNHFPAIDVLDSVSRVADDVTDADHAKARREVLRAMALFREVEDLVQIGAYARGTNRETDAAIDLHGDIEKLLRQGRGDVTEFPEARNMLLKLAREFSDRAKPAGNGQPNRGAAAGR